MEEARAYNSSTQTLAQHRMHLISVITPCFNEEENVREVYSRVKAVFEALGRYRYEHIFIDNASRDRTVEILREIAGGRSQCQGHRQHAQLRASPFAVSRAPGRPAVKP